MFPWKVTSKSQPAILIVNVSFHASNQMSSLIEKCLFSWPSHIFVKNLSLSNVRLVFLWNKTWLNACDRIQPVYEIPVKKNSKPISTTFYDMLLKYHPQSRIVSFHDLLYCFSRYLTNFGLWRHFLLAKQLNYIVTQSKRYTS